MTQELTPLRADKGQPHAAGFYAGKRVAVTGAGGSIGAALAEHFAQQNCAQLALIDQFDHGLIDVVERVSRLNPKLDIVDVLSDVRDGVRLARQMERLQPDIVVHAAALKHVHMGERHAGECVLTNLIGTRNALAAAHAAGASHFTLISSDKAAAPVCVMGATKRLSELHLLEFHRRRAPRMALKSIRFGNVLGSQGSVLPRFRAQIAEGGPLQITHADMERYFMSPGEAVGLIVSLTASNDPSGVYFMEMGEPVSILEMGRKLIAKSGQDVAIEFTGLRAGEKMKEALFDNYERVVASHTPSVFRIDPIAADAGVSADELAQIEQLARAGDNEMIRYRIFALLDATLGREDVAVS
ncbi:MAG: polysaccharide biosynthesis protein [Terricaulis sp.]